MKRLLLAWVTVGILSALGCGPAKAPAPNTAEPSEGNAKVIGASLLNQSHVFYQDLVKAFTDSARKSGYRVTIQYADFDGSKQNNQIETFIFQGVDAIVVSPTDSDSIAPVIARARERHIPVFTVDIAAHNADVVSHIASDNVKGGRLIGEYLAKQLGGKGKVVIIDHPEAASVQERVKGFEEALAKYPDIKIVQKVQGGGERDKAFPVAQDLLQANPDIDAIFGINDDSALAALAAVEAAGLGNKIVIVGYDGTPEARTAILRGSALKADTVQFPDRIGRQAIETIADYFAKKPVPKVVPVDVAIIDAASLKAEGAK